MSARGYLLNELAVSLAIMAIIAVSFGSAVILGVRSEVFGSEQKVLQEEAFFLRDHLFYRLSQSASSGEILSARGNSISITDGASSYEIFLENGTVYERTGATQRLLMGHVTDLEFKYYDSEGQLLQAPVIDPSSISLVDFELTVDVDSDGGGKDYGIRGSYAVKTSQRGH